MTYTEFLNNLANDTLGAFTGKTANEILKYYRKGMRSCTLTKNEHKGFKILESLCK